MTGKQLTQWMEANRITRGDIVTALAVSGRTVTRWRLKGTPHPVDLALERAFVMPGVLAEARKLGERAS